MKCWLIGCSGRTEDRRYVYEMLVVRVCWEVNEKVYNLVCMYVDMMCSRGSIRGCVRNV